MPERVLCEDGLRVSMDGGGARTLVEVRNGVAVRFWADTGVLEGIVSGGGVQLSARDGYCGIDVEDGEVHVAFGLAGKGHKGCVFPATDLADALAWVRSLPTPWGPAPDGMDVGPGAG